MVGCCGNSGVSGVSSMCGTRAWEGWVRGLGFPFFGFDGFMVVVMKFPDLGVFIVGLYRTLGVGRVWRVSEVRVRYFMRFVVCMDGYVQALGFTGVFR